MNVKVDFYRKVQVSSTANLSHFRKSPRLAIFENSGAFPSEAEDLNCDDPLSLEDLAILFPERFGVTAIRLREDIIFIDQFRPMTYRFTVIFEDSPNGSSPRVFSIKNYKDHKIISLDGDQILQLNCSFEIKPAMFRLFAFSELTSRHGSHNKGPMGYSACAPFPTTTLVEVFEV